MNLETTDGVGLLAYAGLGATSRGTQPSDWMSAVLRGRGGLTFVQALGILATVATKELPTHITDIPGGHSIIVPAFIRGVGPRIYTIDNVVDQSTGQHLYRYTSHQRTDSASSPPSGPFAAGGTGGLYLVQKARKDKAWARALLRLGNAHDRGKVSDHLIADHLASLNYEAHQRVGDGSVGPRCIVVWRRRPDARRPAPGGGQQCYTGLDRDRDSAAIPTIAGGTDVASIAGRLIEHLQRRYKDRGNGRSPLLDLDKDEINRWLANLPSEPDEKLR
jgi:hypothetical protein